MTQKLKTFLNRKFSEQIATSKGTNAHLMMEHIVIDDVAGESGDKTIIKTIKSKPELLPYFVASAQKEVPIAGFIDGEFVSKRIDCLLINHETKTIVFIDYKTDTDKNQFIDEYKKQLKGYEILLHSAYPEYAISGYILWLQDWTLTQIV